MKPSAEMRKTMAQMHQVMADCLKSDRPIADCKQEMMNNCPMKKSGHCEMMDQMGGEMGEPMEGYSRQKKDIKSPKEGATIQEAHHPLQH